MVGMLPYLKGGGQVLAAAFTASFLILDIKDETPNEGILWQWWALGAFLSFVAFTTWTQISQLLRIRELTNSRPKPQVDLVARKGSYWLEVKNEGEGANFKIQATFTGFQNCPNPPPDGAYIVEWDTQKDSMPIARHERQELLFVRVLLEFGKRWITTICPTTMFRHGKNFDPFSLYWIADA